MAEVLAAPSPTPHEQGSYFSSKDLLHTSPSQSSFFLGSPHPSLSPPESDSPLHHFDGLRPSHSQPSLLHRTSSFTSTDPTFSFNEYAPTIDDSYDDDICLPSYDNTEPTPQNGQVEDLCDFRQVPEPASTAPTPENDTPVEDPDALLNPVADDIDARQQPSRQVDYLSHDWKEEDIWSSWRHIVARRRVLKDCDVTWLYGPLQEAPRNRRASESNSQISKSASFLKKKPILKKRSVSEEMLQKSISSSSLIKQAAAAVQAQRNVGTRTLPTRPIQRLRRSASDFDGATSYTASTGTAEISSTLPSSTSSGVVSPDTAGAKRRIRFDNNVEQCIAVDFKEGGLEEEANPAWMRACSDEESDDDMPIIKTKPQKKKSISSSSSSRASFSSESKGIVKLPSTTLKYHQEEPDCKGHMASQFKPLRSPAFSPALSPSPSQETLKPAKESSQFLLGGEDGEDGHAPASMPTRFRHLKQDSLSGHTHTLQRDDDAHYEQNGLRRTNSGMFMPFEEGEDDSMASNSLIGRITETVNTAKDICYVLYNVGWRK
ncbi:MAG: hypothetical protein Q9159_004879 [Coniocarpon cinnabarinum]